MPFRFLKKRYILHKWGKGESYPFMDNGRLRGDFGKFTCQNRSEAGMTSACAAELLCEFTKYRYGSMPPSVLPRRHLSIPNSKTSFLY